MYLNRIYLIICLSFANLHLIIAQTDTIIIEEIDESILVNYDKDIPLDTNFVRITNKDSINEIEVSSDTLNLNKSKVLNLSPEEKLVVRRMQSLDDSSPMEFTYNTYTKFYIDRYLGKDLKLINRMLGISPFYFPMMEQQLDRFQIPLELKYLAIVESALNPKARSRSGATGLWQFMYPTGKEYGLKVTSYIDERQDPLKSTIAACVYFQSLYNMFGDWNLVLAAYNGGPSYLKRVMAKTELSDFWELRPYLRKETQGYVPKFIAVSYVMSFYKEHEIEVFNADLKVSERDTVSFKKQAPYHLISDMFCVSVETLNYLNPSFKTEIFPEGETICLPSDVVMDVVRNEDYFYEYLEKVENKEILVNEIRLVYVVQKGDYLGKIAREYGLTVPNIKHWNKLHSDNLSIGDQLILYIPDEK